MQRWRGFRWLVVLVSIVLLAVRLVNTDLWRSVGDTWKDLTTGTHTVARVDGYANNIVFTPDGQGLFTTLQDSGTQLRQVADGTLLHMFGTGFSRSALAADGTRLAITAPATRPTGVQIWQTGPGPRVLHTLPTGEVYGLAFAPNGQLLAVTTGQDVQVWAVADGTRIHTLALDAASLAFTADSRYLAVGIPTEGVQLWRMDDWQKLVTVSGWGTFIALSPDGQLGAMPADVSGGAIRIWRTTDGTRQQTLSGHPNQIHGLAFSPSGTVLASSDNARLVRLWDVNTGTLLQTLELGVNDSVDALAFSPDGQTLAMGSYGALRLWRLPGPIAQAAKHP